MPCHGVHLQANAGFGQTIPSLGLDSQMDGVTIALLLQVEQLNSEIAHAWELLRQQPGGLHCMDMLVRILSPLSSGLILPHFSWTLVIAALQSMRASRNFHNCHIRNGLV